MARQTAVAENAANAAETAATAAKNSAEAARDAILLTHRPRLTARSIVVDSLGDGTLYEMSSGRIRIVNVGTTPATVKGARMQWLVAPVLPMSNPIDAESSHAIEALHLAPGAFVLLALPDKTLTLSEVNAITDPVNGRFLFLIGVVKYIDEKGFWRRTGIARRYNHPLKRFEVVEHHDYEYEE